MADMTKPVVLTEAQYGALLVGTIHNAFSKAIQISNQASLDGVFVALNIVHEQIGKVPHKTLVSRFDVLQ